MNNKFECELIRSSQRKVNLDNLYQLTFETSNPQILDFAKLPSKTLFEIEISIAKKKQYE